ncbi:sigma-70 family RNA polymerase sigma factor [Caldibacillus debilis]|uniref:RNA polymerase sigma factor n=1 Tax=Caldibacillus debilis TaxID=301148 RepID=A0A150M4G4_9BACI|nr:sigma-70 family RNA polymerase sigma factor [Caldibacillus debilis]KYD19251.1 hypothetical protein B4135_2175 [Caldibacillus debilis]
MHSSADVRDAFLIAREREILQMEALEAVKAIMDLYGNEIKRFVYTYMQNPADTDDVTQEVFITVYEKLPEFQGRSMLRSWIYAIAANKCKDHLRKWNLRNRRLKEKMFGHFPILRNNPDTPEEAAIKQHAASQLLERVLSLPVKYREVIVLYYFHDLSVKEIGEMLHEKEGTVRTRLDRAREKLRALLSEERSERDG